MVGKLTESVAESVQLIRRFAAHRLFRSAAVEELELDGDFYRRPLRSEDLEFIDFSTPVTADTACHLSSLASQRILRCILDMNIARPPPTADAAEFARHADFYSDGNRALAARIAPFLETHAFGFLGQAIDERRSDAPELRSQFGAICDAADQFCSDVLRGSFAVDALRFIFVQKWCLAEDKRAALAKARGAGHFDLITPEGCPGLEPNRAEDDIVTQLAAALRVDGRPHTYWQFYLPTSLAEANHVGVLAARSDRALQLIGAAFVAEVEWMQFVRVTAEAGGDLGLLASDDWWRGQLRRRADLEARFARAVNAVADRFGPAGLSEMSRGLQASSRLAQVVRRDLESQLRWLACFDQYVDLARSIDERIRTRQPDIDRETFVEPREMCSTTHVHDDHRLVVIESGHMTFWGNMGMQMRMAPGDMILVPQGRLHGSSVESEQCIYHQPIIPDDWVRSLIDEMAIRAG